MAKLTVTVSLAVILTTLFALSHARIPFSQPSNLVTEFKPSFETENPLRLPSEKSESEPEHEPKSESEPEHEPKSESNVINTDDAIQATGETRPLTVTFDVSFRPINRHFHHMEHHHQRLPHPFWGRFPHRHGCHHHDRQQMMGPREVSYGNDMIVSGSGNEREEVFVMPLTQVEGEKEAGNGVPEIEPLHHENSEKMNWENFEKFNPFFDMEKAKEEEDGFWKKIGKFIPNF